MRLAVKEASMPAFAHLLRALLTSLASLRVPFFFNAKYVNRGIIPWNWWLFLDRDWRIIIYIFDKIGKVSHIYDM